jgi:cobalt-zinc-cadmium efflux system outer membrane protein
LGALLTCVPAKPQERTQVTLEDLVRASLDRNREVLALRQHVTQARGLAQQAGVRPAPSIEAEGTSGSPLGNPGDQEFSAAFVKPLDQRSLIIYTIIISSILYFQRNTTGAALISSKY